MDLKLLLNSFLASISFFSAIPVRFNNLSYKYMLFFLPFVGLILGILVTLLYQIFPKEISPFIVSILYIFLYLGLHLEALFDIVDAYFALLSKKDVYRVLKEPYVGSLGVILGVCFLLLKLVLISFILYQERFIDIILVFIYSRFSIYFVLYFFKFHKNSYLANELAKNIDKKFFILYVFYIKFFIMTLIISMFLANILYKKFKFLNGDSLGFIIEVVEVVLLFSIL